MDTNRKQTDKKPRTPSYKYSFRLNEEQNIRFNELLCKAGLEHNRSRFIVKRLFSEEFIIIKRDPSKTQFVARMNAPISPLGHSHNQLAKILEAFSIEKFGW